jgi:hypothetical protein
MRGESVRTHSVGRSQRHSDARKWTLSDYELTPEEEKDFLRFRAGSKTVDKILTAAGPDWLIEGWLASSATMVDGSPESGKSSLVASMAAAVATREPWLGEPVTTDRQGPVVIIASDPSDMSQWAKKARDLQVNDHDWEIAEFTPERWDAYEDLVDGLESRLLVFDNITSALAGPINDADPTAILAPLGRISSAGTPVVVIAHSGKNTRPGPMGPTAYKAWRRFGINVSGRGDSRTVKRSGNMGSWSDVTLNGTAKGATVEYRLAEDQPKSNRSPKRMDDNAAIADWVVENCQGIGVNETGRRVALAFDGEPSSRITSLKPKGALHKLLKRSGEGGSTAWERVR